MQCEASSWTRRGGPLGSPPLLPAPALHSPQGQRITHAAAASIHSAALAADGTLYTWARGCLGPRSTACGRGGGGVRDSTVTSFSRGLHVSFFHALWRPSGDSNFSPIEKPPKYVCKLCLYVYFFYMNIYVCIHVQKCKPPISHIWELLIFGICLFLMFLCRFHGNLFVSSSQQLLIWGGGVFDFHVVCVCVPRVLSGTAVSLPSNTWRFSKQPCLGLWQWRADGAAGLHGGAEWRPAAHEVLPPAMACHGLLFVGDRTQLNGPHSPTCKPGGRDVLEN